MSRSLLPLLVLLAFPGCLLDPGSCTYEIRTMELEGSISGTVTGQPYSGTARFFLSATKGSFNDRTIGITVNTFLAGAISKVEIRSTSPDAPIATFTPGYSSTPGEWYATMNLTSESPSFASLKILAGSGRIRVIVTVGPAGSGGVMTGALDSSSDSGWDRPNCS